MPSPLIGAAQNRAIGRQGQAGTGLSRLTTGLVGQTHAGRGKGLARGVVAIPANKGVADGREIR